MYMYMEKMKKSISQYGMLIVLTMFIVIMLVALDEIKHYRGWSKFLETSETIEEFVQTLQEEELVELGRVELCFQGEALPYLKNLNAFMISQPLMMQEQEERLPFQGILSVHGENARLVIQKDEYTDNLAAAIEKSHRFCGYLLTDEAYQKIDIILTGMPLVMLSTTHSETPEYSIEQIDDYVYNSETRYYGGIKIYEGEKKAEYNVCFHEKGQTSAIFDKENYAIKLLDGKGKGIEASIFGMPASEKWKLQALYADVTKIREKTAWDLWEEIANAEKMTEQSFRENSAKMEYCEVILDEEYQGLYCMTYPVNEDTLQMKQDDVLYKILDWNMPLPEDIQASIDQNYEVCYPIRIRYPEEYTHIETYWEPMKYYLACKYWVTNFELYADMIYTENLTDYYIFNQVVSGYDNYLKNTYVWAAKAKNKTGYKMVTLPWDMNYTFGDCYVYDGDNNYTAYNADTTVNYVEPGMEQLFRDNVEDCGSLLRKKWNAYRKDILSTEHIQTIMKDNQEQIIRTGALRRETDLWQEVKNTEDISTLLKYVEERMLYLDDYFNDFDAN